MLALTGGVLRKRGAMSPQASQPGILANSDVGVARKREKRKDPQCRNDFEQMFRCGSFTLACTLLPLATTVAHSETADQMQAIMNNPKTFCLRQDLHEYADVSYHECDKYDGLQGSQCTDEVTRRNDIIGKWNALVRGCKASSGGSNLGKAKDRNTDSQQNDMASRFEAALKKAAHANAANQAALEKMKNDEQTDIQEERRRLAEDLRKQQENKAAIAKQVERENEPSILPDKFPPLPIPPGADAREVARLAIYEVRQAFCSNNTAGRTCIVRRWVNNENLRLLQAGVCYDIRQYDMFPAGGGGRVDVICQKN